MRFSLRNWRHAGRVQTRLTRTLALAVMAALAFGVGVVPANAQGGDGLPPGVTQDDVNAVASQMYCDVCEGIPLDACESITCVKWRQEIGRMLGEGRSEDEILDYFVERYGTEVSAVPRDRTDRFLTFAVPTVIALLLGAVGAYQMWRLRQRGQQAGQPVRRSVRLSPQARPVPDDVDPYYLDRLERELEGLEP